MKNHDHQLLIEDTLKTAFTQGRISRREFIQGMLVAGLGIAGVRTLGMPTVARAQDARPLTPTFYQWIIDSPSRH